MFNRKDSRQRRCKCGTAYWPQTSFQKICLSCLVIKTKKDRVRNDNKAAKAKRQQLRADKLLLKTKGSWFEEAQAEFNKWIRWRDRDLPCISCRRYHGGQYHASHYRSRGACPELRFEPLNCHKACSACNKHLSGNIVEYRINLVEKIGEEKLTWLEGPHPPKKYTIDQIKAIKQYYVKLNRESLSGRAS